tara:strand:+ start:20427 stop:20579 length:153 start_codon:yes stop_codon:yes gene_type:complete
MSSLSTLALVKKLCVSLSKRITKILIRVGKLPLIMPLLARYQILGLLSQN